MKNNIRSIRTEICLNDDEKHIVNDIVVKSIKKHIKKNEKHNNRSTILIISSYNSYTQQLFFKIKEAFPANDFELYNENGSVRFYIGEHSLIIANTKTKKEERYEENLANIINTKYTFIINIFSEDSILNEFFDKSFNVWAHFNKEFTTESLSFI